MKKTVLYLFILLLAGQVKAQIQLGKTDMPVPGKTYTIHKSVDSAVWKLQGNIEAGNPGANGVYDFTKLFQLGTDSSRLKLMDPKKFDLGSPFTSANAVVRTEAQVRAYRDPLVFTTNDFPAAGQKYLTNFVQVQDTFSGNIGNYVYYDGKGLGQKFYFDLLRWYAHDSSYVEYMDIATTPWAGKIAGAQAAKLVRTVYDNDGKVMYEIYNIYAQQGNDWMVLGIGAKVDKGLLTSGTPNGTYAYTQAKTHPAYRSRTTSLQYGDSLVDSSAWHASITEGFTKLNHSEQIHISRKAAAAGVLYLPNDSFEVIRVDRIEFRAQYDSIFVFGSLNQSNMDTATHFISEFFAKGFGEPILRLERTARRDSILSMTYLNTMNNQKFSPLKFDTLSQLFSYYNISDTKAEVVGITGIVDPGVLTGMPSGMDTLHAAYSKPQLFVSTSFKDGFKNTDVSKWNIELKLNSFSSVKISTTETNVMEVDGYGTLYLNQDTTDVLRVKVLNTQLQTQTFLVGGFPVNSNTDTITTFRYEYWGKYSGMPLVKLEFDSPDMNWINSCEYVNVPKGVPTNTHSAASEVLALYPNPANDFCKINTGSTAEFEAVVTDLSGKVMWQQRFAGSTQIATAAWPKGMYMVKLNNLQNSKIQVAKLLVE
ncbi:T9SS type A sorting domain-containing protein [bacterium]|nr:T9SS type A sorting domain-containing protein [bacterium]